MTYSLPMILKAIASNQIARFAPGLYVKLTGQTGRGDSATETAVDIAQYFRQCVTDYLDTLNIPQDGRAGFLQDKVVLEYGPGDIPGVALLLVAYGASKVYCVDRFPLVSIARKNLAVIHQLINSLSETERQRLNQCFKNPQAPEVGFNPQRIEYLVRPNGLSGLQGEVDIVISRAVLEHVNDLDATFYVMVQAMKPGALSVHQVDLRSHGLHVANPLDFLSPPNWLWQLMHSHKGVPNRWRADRYQHLIQRLGIVLITFMPTVRFEQSMVSSVRSALALPFHQISDEQLAWQGFWLAFRKVQIDA